MLAKRWRSFSAVLAALTALAALTGLAALALPLAAQQQGEARPRVIVLAFDGADHGLTKRFMEEGALPNLAALAQRGSLLPLEPTNPAESSVSWASFGRGLNPGATNMLGFVCRKSGTYSPELRLMKLGEAATSEHYDAMPAPPLRVPLAVGGVVLGLLIGVLLRRRMLALVLAIASGAAGWVLAPPAHVSERVPTLLPLCEGEPLWQRLDEHGVRVKGLLVPIAAPFDELAHGQMSGGLGVPDALGRPIGTYFIFSTDPKDVPTGTSRKTDSAALVLKLVERDGAYRAELPGPKDLARRDAVTARLDELKRELASSDLAAARKEALLAEQKQLAKERDAGFEATLEVTVRRAGERRVEVRIGDRAATVAEGEWSDWLPLHFGLPWPLDSAALARVRVMDAGEHIRVFCAPMGYDPREIPPHLRMEYPPGFCADAANAAGLFDTTGWACLTNPLKDDEVDEAVFLEHIEKLTEERSRTVYEELAQDDWDFFFAMFGETDRVQHLMFRLFDPQHPRYDAELAERYGSAIEDAYRAMDRIVGEVMQKHVDDRTVLMVLSDHGFTSFRRQLALNTWLMQEGYLVPNGELRDPAQLWDSLSASQRDLLRFMDRSKSRAYALGIGKIYVNLAGREPQGIVPAAEYDALCAEITQKLLALRDPATGEAAVRRVWRHDELYHGPWADSDADLFLGFAANYRVSWSTTLGGFSRQAFEDNDSKWSGDHACNDPEVVPGVLFTNRPLAEGLHPRIIDMAPTILSLLGVEPEGMDGKLLPFR